MSRRIRAAEIAAPPCAVFLAWNPPQSRVSSRVMVNSCGEECQRVATGFAGIHSGSLSELLYLTEALPARFVRRARGMAAHAKTVTVQILHIHFPNTPRHIRRRLANDRAARLVLLMKRIHILHEEAHPCAGLPLASFTKENVTLAPRDTAECRRIAPVPFPPETQFVDVVVH